MNIGERNELKLKCALIWMRDNHILRPCPFDHIRSVGFDGIEYPNMSPDINLGNLSGMDDCALSTLTRSLNIGKSPTNSKSDVYINGIGCSVKSYESAPPALVNHTARPGFEVACRHARVSITDIDDLIDKYWKLRERGRIGEDIINSSALSPFKDAKVILKPVLKYFLFLGTGSGLSQHPAEYILDYVNPVDSSTWKIMDKDDVIDFVWNKLIFSIRATKGMPKSYPQNFNKSNNVSIEKWTRHMQGKYRGAFHIRCGR